MRNRNLEQKNQNLAKFQYKDMPLYARPYGNKIIIVD